MHRNLIEIGGNKALVLSRDMLEHLGVTDAVEVVFEEGRIIVTAAVAKDTPAGAQTFEAAADETLTQYDEALRRLSL